MQIAALCGRGDAVPDHFFQQDDSEEALRWKACPGVAVNIAGLDDLEHRVLFGRTERSEIRAEAATTIVIDSLEAETPRLA